MFDRGEVDPLNSIAQRVIGEIERSLCLSTDVAFVADAELRTTYEAGLRWMKQFIMRPHPNLGRKGAVCPFAAPAHDERVMYFAALNSAGITFDAFIQIMLRLPAVFQRLATRIEGRTDLLSLCIFPRDLHADEYYKFIDCAHGMLKPFYMNTGLMIGEFHPLSAVRGAHSDTILPMRSDVPMFVVRAMASHDILFIDRDGASPTQRIHEVECYLRFVGPQLPPSEAARLQQRLELLKAQLLLADPGLVERRGAVSAS